MLEEFQKIGKFLFAEGLVDAYGGNMSVLQGDKILITRRDAMLGDLQKGDIVEVGVEPGDKDAEASRELATHRAVYKQGKAKAIIHAHPANAIAISITDNKVVPQDAEGLYFFKSAPIVRVRDGIGSEETVRLLPSFLSGSNVIAMVKGHGSFAIGADLSEAYKYTSAIENSCKVLVAIRSSQGQGRSPGGRSEGPSRGRGRIEDRGPSRGPSRQTGRGPGRGSAIPPGIGVMGGHKRERGR